MCRHHHIRPVERDCICLERKPDGPHIAACNAAFRVKFLGTWSGVRQGFYAEAAGTQIAGAVHGAAMRN